MNKIAPNNSDTPPLRIVHQLGRCGGTLINRCIACMNGVNLLSEIHPLAIKTFNPLAQAKNWHNLLKPEDFEVLARNKGTNFVGAIQLIERRCSGNGQSLVIRDWNHLDFFGVPFLKAPTKRLLTAEMVGNHFQLKRIAIVRHPIDQWLSTCNVASLSNLINLERFLEGYYHFVRRCIQYSMFKYEDFCSNPKAVMKGICDALDLPYDSSFVDNWNKFNKITGDIKSERGGSAINPMPRRKHAPELLERFQNNECYQKSIELIGYGLT